MENENHDQNNDLKEIIEDVQRPQEHLEPKLPPVFAAMIGLIGVFILYQFGGSIMVISILGFDFTGDVYVFRLLTIAGQILFILIPALVLSKLVYDNVFKVIRFKLPAWKEVLIFSLGLLLLNIALQSYLYIQNYLLTKLASIIPFIDQAKNLLDQFDKTIEESYAKLLIANSLWESLLVVAVVAITPAVCEEIFFRGYVQRTFEMKYKAFKSASFTAIFFGLYHFHPYQIIPLTALGLYFGYAVYKSDSIFVPIILHFLNNFIAVLIFFYSGKDLSKSQSVSVSDFQLSLFLFVALSILFILLMVIFNRIYYRRYSK